MKIRCVTIICVLMMVVFVGQGYTEELQPLTIQLNWFPTVQFAGITLAKERGYYEEAGIDLTIKSYEWGMIPIDEVLAGNAQIGIAEGDDLIKARVKGTPIKAIAVQYQKSPFCIMSKKRQDIETPEQLAGKRVGIADPASVIMTKLILRSAGLQYEDITPVDYKWDLQYIIEDKVDACVGFMNDEPLMLKEQGYEMNVIPGFKHGYDFYSGAYVVTENMLQEQPELVRSFLNATRRGWREAFKRPAETAQLVVGKYFPDGSVSQQTESLKVFETLATLGIREDLLGFMKEREWQKGIDILYEFQQIDKKIPARDLFTLEFLKR